jgi:hypothetical protein
MAAVVRALLGWFGGASALGTLSAVVLAVCALVLGLTYRRYLGILGADRRRPAERQAYDGLRNSLAEGNLAARLYADWLTRFLDWIDRFFGDAGMADRTLFPHAFGLRTPAPLWTPAAFDRCLLLALIYPIATIFAIWTISGHVGPAEAALRLAPGLPGWRRGLLIVLTIFLGGTWLRAFRPTGWRFLLWLAVALAVGVAGGGAVAVGVIFAGCVAFAVATAVLVGGAVAVAVGVAEAGAVAGVGAIAVFGAVAGAVGVAEAAVAGADAFAVAGADAFVVCGAIAGAFAFAIAVASANYAMANHGRQGVFLSFFVATMVLACLVAARLLSHLEGWEISGPLLLFLGLLTLLNAPFDWASLGLTRALLRRGLELGGRWPYALALVDAGLAAVVIAALALAMTVGIQAFEALAVHDGARRSCHWSRFSAELRQIRRLPNTGGSTRSCSRR